MAAVSAHRPPLTTPLDMGSLDAQHGPPDRRARILQLPEEITEAILRHVRETACSVDFWSCLKTCQDWHRIGLGIHGALDHSVSVILETEVRRQSLEEERLDTSTGHLTDFCLGNPSRFFIFELRSLTIHVLHARIAAPFNALAGTDLFTSLTDTLKMTRRLSTFSLKFASDGWDFPHEDVPVVLGSQLAQVVSSLPATVANLEIDTAGIDVPPGVEITMGHSSKHLCHQINKIVTRLHHLRLRVGHICDELLSGATKLLPSPNSPRDLSCSGSGTKRTCSMRSLTIWLPGGLERDHSMLSMPNLLLMLALPSEISISIISRITPESVEAGRETTEYFYPSFDWRVLCNSFAHNGQHVRVHMTQKSLSDCSYNRTMHHLPACREHELLCPVALRHFQVGADLYPTSPYPYIAEWALEGSSRWSQTAYNGPRYPAAGDRRDLSLRSPYHGSHGVYTMKDTEAGEDLGQWTCLFPGCRTCCKSLHNLRGHHLYQHPTQPHVETHPANVPCPSVGCNRIGPRAFSSRTELESHLLSHHINACSHQDSGSRFQSAAYHQ